MRKPKSPTSPETSARNAARLGRPVHHTQKGQWSQPRDEAKWANPTFMEMVSINGHYAGDDCRPSHWFPTKDNPYRSAYNRANQWWFYRTPCPRCGKEHRIGSEAVRAGRNQLCLSCRWEVVQNRSSARKAEAAREIQMRKDMRRDALAEVGMGMGRVDTMLLYRAMGMTLEAIAERFGITKQRVMQLLQRRLVRLALPLNTSPDGCLMALVTCYRLVPVIDMLETEDGESEADAPLAEGEHAV
jgi:hypothetical protein